MFVVHSNAGWVEVIAGNMGTGKSAELLRRVRIAARAGRRVALFTSKLDHQHPAPLTLDLGDGVSVASSAVATADDLLRAVGAEVEVVAIDEVQFFDAAIGTALATLANQGVQVICAGLDTDYRGRTFGPMGDILAQAESVTKLTGICRQCGGTANRTQRLVAGRPAHVQSPTIETRHAIVYESRCRACHMVPEDAPPVQEAAP
jgi:thymidine kinase